MTLVNLTDWELEQLLSFAASRALTYMQYQALNQLRDTEIETGRKWKTLCDKLGGESEMVMIKEFWSGLRIGSVSLDATTPQGGGSGVRAYRGSPRAMTLQLRKSPEFGKKQERYMTAYMPFSEAHKLAHWILENIPEKEQ